MHKIKSFVFWFMAAWDIITMFHSVRGKKSEITNGTLNFLTAGMLKCPKS